VRGIDDLSTGTARNVEDLERAGGGRFRFVVGDVRDPSKVALLVDGADAVYHLAANVGVRRVVERPADTLAVNIGGTENVLACAAKKRARTFVFSTSEVYGKAAVVPFCEDHDVVLGRSSVARWGYAASKLVDEFLALAYHQERGLPVVVVRCFNVAGPRQTGAYGMVLPRFCRWALRGEPLQVYGDGLQTRSFCHVDDLVEALALLTECRAADGRVLNVGNPVEVAVGELADRVARLARSSSAIERVPYERAYGSGYEDMRRRVPCLHRISELLGWAPKRDLDRIVTDVLDEMREEGEVRG
jgi:UDP-glucose 4-epimerase